jgi:GH43 family beta-xylosidase
LEVFFFLIPGRLSHGDDANLLIGFRVRDDDDDVLEHSKGYETVLAVFESVVLNRQSDPGENFWSVLEVDAVLL